MQTFVRGSVSLVQILCPVLQAGSCRGLESHTNLRRRSFVMISANAALPSFYDYGEVARSVLIAIAASYVALDLVGRVTAAGGWVRLAWWSGGSTAMGIGIWEMHLKGMLALHLPVPQEYHWPTLLAAL